MTGGFGSYLIALDERTYELIGADYPGNRIEDVKKPGLGWMIGFLFVVSFLGLFSLVPLRKVAAIVVDCNIIVLLLIFYFSESTAIFVYLCKRLITSPIWLWICCPDRVIEARFTSRW